MSRRSAHDSYNVDGVHIATLVSRDAASASERERLWDLHIHSVAVVANLATGEPRISPPHIEAPHSRNLKILASRWAGLGRLHTRLLSRSNGVAAVPRLELIAGRRAAHRPPAGELYQHTTPLGVPTSSGFRPSWTAAMLRLSALSRLSVCRYFSVMATFAWPRSAWTEGAGGAAARAFTQSAPGLRCHW